MTRQSALDRRRNRGIMNIEKGVADRRLAHILVSKNCRLVYRQGGYFCVLFTSSPNVYPIVKQVKPKLTTAIRSTILIGLALLSTGFLYRFLCNQRVTGLRFTSVVAKRVPLALCNPLEKD